MKGTSDSCLRNMIKTVKIEQSIHSSWNDIAGVASRKDGSLVREWELAVCEKIFRLPRLFGPT
jgi:hypothetical protein